ncbi:MAG: cell division protein FtsZ [Candidatus Altiarchaeota archaeon]|nr:cell division protein FtsZ [Candidatus Altiarchaeota archaeon]
MKKMIKKATRVKKNKQEYEKFLNSHSPLIKVFGVGGSGGNTIVRLKEMGIEGAEMAAINTDAQDLAKIDVKDKILIGREVTKGLGAGSDPNVGEQAAKEDETNLKKAIGKPDLAFITCGLGGGTGSGAAPIVAELAKKSGALTIAVVTLPFNNEGVLRWENARYGLERIKNHVDAVIIIPNQKLLEIVPDLPLVTAFRVADEVLSNAVKAITIMVTSQGLVNVDFADLKAVMTGAGTALIGVGESDSEKRAEEAVFKAVNNPLLDVELSGAKGALIYIEGSKSLKLEESYNIIDLISKYLNSDAKLIWGVGLPDETLGNTVRILVILTGADMNKFYYPEQESMEKREKAKMGSELGIEFIEVEE